MQEKNVNLRQELAQLQADLRDVYEKLRTYVKECHIINSKKSGSFEGHSKDTQPSR